MPPLRAGAPVVAIVLVAMTAGCVSGPAMDGTASARQTHPRPSASHPRPVAPRTGAAAPVAPPAPAGPVPSVTRVPPVSAAARQAGLIDVRTVVPDAIIDLRYATVHNFVGARLYPSDARCLVHRSMAHGLSVAADRLRRSGDLLVFWDCYRPHSAQVRMFRAFPDPSFVAKPGPYAYSHEAARSVDVTLARRATSASCPTRSLHRHCLLRMGTKFDSFSARAHAFATAGVSARARADRAHLRRAMNAGGLRVYTGEWWHFDAPGAAVHRPILPVPVD